MIRLSLMCLALLILNSPAIAQELELRSGEHETFSRLTLNMSERLDYAIEESPRGARVTFSNKRIAVDTSKVFEKIPRDRLAKAAWNTETQSLDLTFACDCSIETSWYGPSLLVLDVVEARAEQTSESITETSSTNVDIPWRGGSHASKLVVGTIQAQGPVRQNSQELLANQDQSDEALQEMRDDLLGQVSRAVSQGLISPREAIPKKLENKSIGPTSAASIPNHTSDPDVSRRHINMSTRSTVDREFTNGLPTSFDALVHQECLPDTQVSVSSWGTSAPFGKQISALRLELTGEFDDPKQTTALKLARLYLFFGFGAEAKNILRMVNSESLEKEILLELADIADFGFAQDNPVLQKQASCEGSVALWSLLSYETIPEDTPVDTNAVLRSFNALPVHLRKHYGPTLAKSFLETGQTEVADKILSILDRAKLTENPEAELAKANAAKLKGKHDDSASMLEGLIETNSAVAAEALVQSIEVKIRAGKEIPLEQAELVAAYAFEKQNESDAPGLFATEVLALAASGAFDASLERFSEYGKYFEDEKSAEIESAILQFLSSNADDITFLKHILNTEEANVPSMQPSVANLVAARALALGFPEHAEKIIEKVVSLDPETIRKTQILRAEILLASNKPHQALVEVLGLIGADANVIRAQAQSKIGNYGAAFDLYESANDSRRADQEAWFNGEWNQVAKSEDMAKADFASMLTQTASTGSLNQTSQPELARNRALLETSSKTREILSALLKVDQAEGELLSEQ